jgi:hypothetical protein
MSKRTVKTGTTVKPPANPPKPDQAMEREIARFWLRPSLNGALTLHHVIGKRSPSESKVTLGGLIDELSAQCAEVSGGSMARPEAMLTTQAHTLDGLFHYLTGLAHNNFKNFEVAERLFRLAFKAQSQSRATIETLGALKNPPMVFAKQANVTTGPQQVNNGIALARETENQPNKLLEQSDGERLDSGAAGATGAPDSALETVGAVNRTEDNRG